AAKLDEFNAGRVVAPPDHLTRPPGSRVARKGQAEPRRQRDRALDPDFCAGRGNVMHHALACSKAAVERDPGLPSQQFASLAFFLCSHQGPSTHARVTLWAAKKPLI